MYGDNHFLLVQSGSTAASANTAHGLWGSYNGLSNLNNGEVIHIQTMPIGGEALIGFDNTVSNNIGYKIFATASYIDLPPVRIGSASGMHFANSVLGTNASVSWTIWRRAPAVR